ncbi:MAG TPA: hypothetical protein VG984_01995 [Candidatus Paceibacterota bacterium]|nr:hypothetical protein [Candidatus Paceibacterota bacterium]
MSEAATGGYADKMTIRLNLKSFTHIASIDIVGTGPANVTPSGPVHNVMIDFGAIYDAICPA